MPRLTDSTYLQHRQFLVHEWASGGRSFADLGSLEQWDLHSFYSPAEFLADKQAIAHRRDMTAHDHSLPNTAGKACKHLLQVIEQRAALVAQPKPTPGPRERNGRKPVYNVKVSATVRPKVNYELLAKAFLEYVDTEERKKREQP